MMESRINEFLLCEKIEITSLQEEQDKLSDIFRLKVQQKHFKNRNSRLNMS